MNRIEYMTQLAALLQDVPAEERVSAMRYYNDYFDEAGEENEARVIAELGSPEKVAAEMKAGLERASEESGEFRETGYTDTQFEQKEVPVIREDAQKRTGEHRAQKEKEAAYHYGEEEAAYHDSEEEATYHYGEEEAGEGKPWEKKWVKIAVAVVIVLAAASVVFPLISGIVSILLAVVIVPFALLVALVLASAAVAISGIIIGVKGVFMIGSALPVAMVILGVGMILVMLGILGTAASVKLCITVIPAMFRFLKGIVCKLFRGRKAVA